MSDTDTADPSHRQDDGRSMNAGGHVAVVARALAGGDDAGEAARAARLLGSALPDLATIGRFRLLGSTTNSDVARGIGFHHRTDDLFHGHQWFRTRNRALTAELSNAGLGRGPAMACSHVGIELLLDGRLLQEHDVAEANRTAFDAIDELRPSLKGLVDDHKQSSWLEHLDRLSAHRLPTDYHDPDAVAARLFRILSARPRLALAKNHIATVAAALAERRDDIDNTALHLVDQLANDLPNTVAAEI